MKRSICLLPSGEMLKLRPVKHWTQLFSEFTRRTATEVALPAIGFAGPFYDSSVHVVPNGYGTANLLPDWIRTCRETLGDDTKVWANVIVDLQFLDNEAVFLRSQFLQTLPQACLVNPVAQAVLVDIIDELAAIGGVSGIVFDLTDCYPNSGAAGFEGISAHCFCNYCVSAMRGHGFKEPLDAFVGPDSILRFALRVDVDGAAHIDPPQAWIDSVDAKSLIHYSVARRFITNEEPNQDRDATRLLKYFDARVRTTAEAVRTITRACQSREMRSAIILGSDACDLSQLVSLPALQRINAADEYWVPDVSQTPVETGDGDCVQFLAGRASYQMNSFFEHVELAQRRSIELGPEKFLQILLRTSKGLMNNKLGPGSAYVVDKLPQFIGMAGVPLGTDEHFEIVKRLSSEVTGSVLPPDVLEGFRIADPDRLTHASTGAVNLVEAEGQVDNGS